MGEDDPRVHLAFNGQLFRAMLPVHRSTDRAGRLRLQAHLIGVYQKP